ncbi:hypothetical protein GYMLUDRAFT_240656 [Collybiopsis luxurians FD-317 M1]|nr:hypothetical protein GYMLUDRAFT_240656 [Collybiopsis luxurians FD-317 M1]
MACALCELVDQVFTEDTLPTVSNPILWMILLVFIILLILRCVWFSCLSSRKLNTTIKDVEKMLGGYQKNIRSHWLSDMIDCEQHKRLYKDYKDQLRRIQHVAHKRFVADYKIAKWRKYVSLSRALTLSSSYRSLRRLKEDIQVGFSPSMLKVCGLITSGCIHCFVVLEYAGVKGS